MEQKNMMIVIQVAILVIVSATATILSSYLAAKLTTGNVEKISIAERQKHLLSQLLDRRIQAYEEIYSTLENYYISVADAIPERFIKDDHNRLGAEYEKTIRKRDIWLDSESRSKVFDFLNYIEVSNTMKGCSRSEFDRLYSDARVALKRNLRLCIRASEKITP